MKKQYWCHDCQQAQDAEEVDIQAGIVECLGCGEKMHARKSVKGIWHYKCPQCERYQDLFVFDCPKWYGPKGLEINLRAGVEGGCRECRGIPKENESEEKKREPPSASDYVAIAAVLAFLYWLFVFAFPYNPNLPPLTPEEEYDRLWEEMNDPYDQRPY